MARITEPSKPARRKAGDDSAAEPRARILAVAEDLFFRRGYANTTLDQIAGALGVTKPFVYYYFTNKLEIFETLAWNSAVECLTSMDFPHDDPRPAHLKLAEGFERLIRATLSTHPRATFAYREPQVFRPEYLRAQKRLANHFYAKARALLEQGRRDGTLEFGDTTITALAAGSVPGFLYTWYRPDGRLSLDEVVRELSEIVWRILGVRRTPRHARP